MEKTTFLNKILKKKPNNFKIFNYDLLPAEFRFDEPVDIVCNQHGVFREKPVAHLFTHGCKECSAERVIKEKHRVNKEAFIAKSKAKYGDKFDHSRSVYSGKEHKARLHCSVHGDIQIYPASHFVMKTGCGLCEYETNLKNRFVFFMKRVKKKHGDLYDYSKVKYTNHTSPIEIICKVHGSFWQIAECHVRGSICPTCSTEGQRLTTSDFIEKSKAIHGPDTYGYDKVVYLKNTSVVTITCKTHGDFNQAARSHLNGNGCKKCHILSLRKNIQEFIAEAESIHGKRYDYSKVVYVSNKRKVEIICPDHGSFFITPNSHLTSRQGCRCCNDSKGEVAISAILDKYGIKYVREHRFPGSRFRFDFYLPLINMCVEFHGLQHYTPVEFFGGVEEYRKRILHDELKENLLKGLKIPLVVISYQFLNQELLERQLILSFLKRFKIWLRINGSVLAFKDTAMLMSTYGHNTEDGVKCKSLEEVVECIRSAGNEVDIIFQNFV